MLFYDLLLPTAPNGAIEALQPLPIATKKLSMSVLIYFKSRELH